MSIWQVQIHETTILTSPVGDMFQKKIDELFSGMSNILGIADVTLIVGFDKWGKKHDEMFEKVPLVSR